MLRKVAESTLRMHNGCEGMHPGLVEPEKMV